MEETQVRKHLYAASAILAAILVVFVGGLSPVPGRAQTDPASRAIRFLASQEQADGSLPGFSSFDGTEFFVIGAAAAGYDPNQLRTGSGQTPVAFLATNVTAASADAGNTGRLIQAAVAAGGNPAAFGPAASPMDLVAKLTGPDYSSAGPSAGAFGNGQTATQSLAIEGLLMAGLTPPADSVAYLKARQNSDGGFNYTAAPNDPAGSDTNSTAAAVMALDAAGNHSADAAAIAWLRTTSQQQPDGGFGYQGGPSDPDSTALVIQMLISAGQDPNGPLWTISGKTPYSALLAVQDPGGGFVGFSGTPDAGTTSQALFGLLQQPLPARGVYQNGFSLAASAASGLAALQFLQSLQSNATGGVPAGFSPYDSSEFYAIGAAAAGYDPKLLATCGGPSVMQYLANNAVAATPDAGNTARLIQAVLAARQSPSSFGSVSLLARLQSFYDPVTGAFGDGQTATQSLALQALVVAGQAPSAAAVAHLKALQDGDGGWNYTAVRNDPSGSDTNSTAVALMALAAVGDHANDRTALSWLRTQAQPDGGFGYQGPPSDAVSSALVTQALYATFQDPASTNPTNGWAVSRKSPLVYLLAQQQSGGGFLGYSGSADAGTTSQVLAALERRPYPIPAPASSAALPGESCPSPSPTPTLTPTPTPTPTPAPTPTAAPLAPAGAPSASEPGAVVEAPTTPTASPVPAASPSPTAAESRPSNGPTSQPLTANAARDDGGSLPPALIYGLIAASALLIVVGAGAGYVVYFRR
jgi:prenyltransferase beta subunit